MFCIVVYQLRNINANDTAINIILQKQTILMFKLFPSDVTM